MNSQEIEETVKAVRHYFDHDAQKQILKEKYEAKMLFAAFGGMWKAGPDLLTITAGCRHADEIVLLDEYGNPCKVNPGELHSMGVERWQEQMNAWYQDFEALQRQR